MCKAGANQSASLLFLRLYKNPRPQHNTALQSLSIFSCERWRTSLVSRVCRTLVMPLVTPYRSIGARERTQGPKPNCACTALLRPLSNSKGRESALVLHWTSFTLEANSRPELPTLGPFSPFFASGVDSRPKKSKNSLGPRPSGLGSGGVTLAGRVQECIRQKL